MRDHYRIHNYLVANGLIGAEDCWKEYINGSANDLNYMSLYCLCNCINEAKEYLNKYKKKLIAKVPKTYEMAIEIMKDHNPGALIDDQFIIMDVRKKMKRLCKLVSWSKKDFETKIRMPLFFSDNELKLDTVTGVRYAMVTKKFRDLFTQDGWNMIKHKGKGYYFIESIKTDEDNVIISSDGWNKDNLIKTGIINELKCPNNKCWNIESLYKNNLVYDGGFSSAIKNPIGGMRIVGDTVLIINSDILSNLKLDTKYLKTRWRIKEDSIVLNKYECLRLDDTIFEFNKYLDCEGYLANSKPPCEIDYYYDKSFVDAWFVDNIGSFMIVIERKKVR